MQIPGLSLAANALEDIDSLAWRSTRHDGISWIDLASSEDGTATVLIRMAPGCGYPAHRHVGAEDVLVLSGGYRDDDGRELRAGEFFRYPVGSVHAPVATGVAGDPACVLFAVAHQGTALVEGPASTDGSGTRGLDHDE